MLALSIMMEAPHPPPSSHQGNHLNVSPRPIIPQSLAHLPRAVTGLGGRRVFPHLSPQNPTPTGVPFPETQGDGLEEAHLYVTAAATPALQDSL